MDSLEPHLVITGISDPEFEGLVSSALFTKGWNVVARALDFSELQTALAKHSSEKLLVIFSTDLPGLTSRTLSEISNVNIIFFGFADESGSDRGIAKISLRPTTPQDLLLAILENVRSTSGRTPLIHSPVNLSAKVFAIGGVRHCVGATTLALNLAQELALSGSQTLIVDANFPAPAIATLLDLRHLAGEPKWREVAPFLHAMELTREKLDHFDDLIAEAGERFEQIIIDLGTVANLANEISDRRWSAKIKIWTSHNADNFLLISNTELMSQNALEEFIQSAAGLSLNSKLHLIKVHKYVKNNPRSKQLAAVSPKSAKSWNLPWDQRSCESAIAERTTLVQVAERSSLRKEITTIAQALGGKKSR